MLKEGQIVQVKHRLKVKSCKDGLAITSEMVELKGQYVIIEKRVDKNRYIIEQDENGLYWNEECFTKESIEEHNFVRGEAIYKGLKENDIVIYDGQYAIGEKKDTHSVLKYDEFVGAWYLDYFEEQSFTHKRSGSDKKSLFESTGWNLGYSLNIDKIEVVKPAYEDLGEFTKKIEKERGKKKMGRKVEAVVGEVIETEEDLKQEQFRFDNEVMEKLSTSIDKLTKKIEKEDPFKKAMIEAIIEKGKDLAIDDLKKRLKTDIDKYIEETYGTLPKKIAIEKDGVVKKELTGLFHSKFEEICKIVSGNVPLMLVGGAGAGKNHTLEQVAEALDLEFYTTNAVNQEYKLTGFIDANGRYHETEFYKAFTNGGLFFLDEIDASSPEALIVLNGAIANKYFDFPIGRVNAHKDFRVVCAGNTYGTGADMVYVGRNVLDGATLDRFVVVQFDYDEEVEKTLAYDLDLFKFIRDLRDSIEKAGLRYIVSMRALINATKLLELGIDKQTILKTTIIKNMQKDDLNLVVEKLNTSNPWYSEVKRLCD